MAEHVVEPAPGEPVHRRRDAAAAAELGRDHELALVLGLDGQEAVAVDVDVEVVPVAAPRLHPLEHRLPLRGVVDDVHVRAGQEPGAAPAGVHVDHDVREREQDAREVVGELLVRRAVGAAGERAVEVRAGGPVARVRLRRGRGEHGDHDHAARDLLGLQLLEQPQRGDLALVLVAVVPGEHEDGRPLAVRDRPDVDERARPARRVRDLREREVPDLLAGGGEVDRAGDGSGSCGDLRSAARRAGSKHSGGACCNDHSGSPVAASSARSASRVIGSPTNAKPLALRDERAGAHAEEEARPLGQDLDRRLRRRVERPDARDRLSALDRLARHRRAPRRSRSRVLSSGP